MDALPVLMRSWWILALRGALAVALGILALVLPGLTLLTIIALFAVYVLLAGIICLAGAIRNRRHARGPRKLEWWLLLVLGLVSVAAGILATLQPLLTLFVLVLVVGINAVVSGILDLMMAARLRGHLRGGEWLLIVSAIASIVFGAILIATPGIGALALVWLVAVYALVAGALYLALAFQAFRSHRADGGGSHHQPERRATADRRMRHAGQT
jgi:uncharacterized membrane protein HdeD (DUF308 family)